MGDRDALNRAGDLVNVVRKVTDLLHTAPAVYCDMGPHAGLFHVKITQPIYLTPEELQIVREGKKADEH